MNQVAYQMQDEVFDRADEFDPWRMYRERMKKGEELKHQYVMTSDKNLHFGHGKHACPGRFFAANEVKTLLVLLLMRFELTFSGDVSWQDIRNGQPYAVGRSPVSNVDVEIRSRTEKIPGDLRSFFV